MRCEQAAGWLHRLMDGELAAPARWRLRRHLAVCTACAAELEEQRTMQAALRDQLAYHRAPPALVGRIVAALPLDTPPLPRRPWFRLLPVTLGGSGLVGALAGAALVLLVHGGVETPSPVGAVIDSHIASMMADHLTDVQTSDRHTVKPWLSAHGDVSPPVRELAAEGYPLVGGRIDYVAGHRAAAVVYRHDRHIINLFAWASPGQPDVPPSRAERQGFTVIDWRAAGISYFAVSDLEPDLLARFVALVRN